MNIRQKSLIKNWHIDKGISISEQEIEFFKRKSFARYKIIINRSQKIGFDIKSFKEAQNIWKTNIVLARFIFKYSLFFENYLESSIERYIHSYDLNNAFETYKLHFNQSINDIERDNLTKKKRDKKIDMLHYELSIIEKFKSDKDFVDIKLSKKIIIYNKLIIGTQFELPIKDLNKIRTIRNKSVHSDFILDYFVISPNAIDIIYSLVDEPYKSQFLKEIEEIAKKYNMQDVIVYNNID